MATTWPYHLAEAFLGWERAGVCSPAQNDRDLANIWSFPFAFDTAATDQTWSDVLDLARTHSLAVFDAAYLELALRLGLPLATVDATLHRAAAAAGVPLFVP